MIRIISRQFDSRTQQLSFQLQLGNRISIPRSQNKLFLYTHTHHITSHSTNQQIIIKTYCLHCKADTTTLTSISSTNEPRMSFVESIILSMSLLVHLLRASFLLILLLLIEMLMELMVEHLER